MSRSFRYAFFILLVILYAAATFAATFIVPSDREMVRRTDAIVVGSALSSYSQTTTNNRIETVTTFSVHEVIKGRADLGVTIDIHEPGGRIGDRISFIPGVPSFETGEESILFLMRTPQGTWAVTDIALGHFVLHSDANGHKFAIREDAELDASPNPDGSAHREMARSADAFLEFLRAEARGEQGRSDYNVTPAHKLSIAPASLRLTPNTVFSATSYASDIENCPGMNCGTGRGSRWNVFPGSSVTIFTEPDGITNARALISVASAVNGWTADPRSNVRYVTASDSCMPQPTCHHGGLIGGTDSANTVLFERNLTSIGIPAFSCPSGTLGVGGLSQASGTHSGPNSESFFTSVEADVEMNQGVLPCVSFAQGDLNSAVTHEVGHTLGFRHSDQTRANNPGIACSTDATLDCESTTAIMKSIIPNGLGGILPAYDVRAVRAIYPCSLGGGCSKVRTDLSGDSKSDIVLRDTGGNIGLWTMNGSTITAGAFVGSPGVAYTIAGVADFDGDGKADILLRDTNGNLGMWIMNGSIISSGAFVGSPGAGYTVAGVGDFDGDGKADILLRDTSGNLGMWIMNGPVISSGFFVGSPGGSYTVAAVADFDGDGKADILLRDSGGSLGMWIMNGATIVSGAFVGSPGGSYNVAAAGDYNGDGRADILLRDSSGSLGLWTMNGATIVAGAFVGSPGTGYTEF